MEPRKNEGPRDWQNLFAIPMFRYIEVLFHIFYYYWSEDTLGARDFSCAVSGFCQVFMVTRAKASRLRPTAEDVSAFGQHRKFPPHARKTSGTRGKVKKIVRYTEDFAV